MRTTFRDLPGIDQVRARFIEMLKERKTMIASYAIAAWGSKTLVDTQKNLVAAQTILHQIAGSAGSLGFHALGQSAKDCEDEITKHLESAAANLPNCPAEIVHHFDVFIADCQNLLDVQLK